MADKKPAVAENIIQKTLKDGAAVDLDEDESEENKKKRHEQIEKDKLKY